jgi:hypothetical protein
MGFFILLPRQIQGILTGTATAGLALNHKGRCPRGLDHPSVARA